MSVLVEYFEALERLKNGKPLAVAKDTRISNDSVALEAGRQKGSIKKSREIFNKLIEAIDDAARLQMLPATKDFEKLRELKLRAEKFRLLYEEALAREIMLIRHIYELERKIEKDTKYNIVDITLEK